MKTEMEQFTTTILEGMDAALGNFERRITSTMNSGFGKLDERMLSVENRLTSVEIKTSKLEQTVHDLQEELKLGFKVIDKHSLDIFDHTKRVRRLEKRIA